MDVHYNYKIKTDKPIKVQYNNNGFIIKDNDFNISKIVYTGTTKKHTRSFQSKTKPFVKKSINEFFEYINFTQIKASNLRNRLFNIPVIKNIAILFYYVVLCLITLCMLILAPIMSYIEKRVNIIYKSCIILYVSGMMLGIIANISVLNFLAGLLSIIYTIFTIDYVQEHIEADFCYLTGQEIYRNNQVFLVSILITLFMFMILSIIEKLIPIVLFHNGMSVLGQVLSVISLGIFVHDAST